jgi:hypothetical protein
VRSGVSLLGEVWAPLAVSAHGAPSAPSVGVQRYHVLLVSLVIGQAGYESVSFLASIFVNDNQSTPMPMGSVDFLFWEGPFGAGRFLAFFLVIRGSRASTPAGQSSVGMSETYTEAQSWPRI